MTRYTVIMSGAELEVVALALGRMLDAKPIVAPRERAKRPAAVKPPTLRRGAFVKLTKRWEAAVEDPTKWHYPLQYRAAAATNRQASEMNRVWGIV